MASAQAKDPRFAPPVQTALRLPGSFRPAPVAFLNRRAPRQREQMDDLDAGGPALIRALEDLRWVNRWLGGYASVQHALRPLVKRCRGRREHPNGVTRRGPPLRLLDLGAGGADLPAHLVRWADGQGVPLRVTALDANPHAVRYARQALARRLPAYLRARVKVEEGEALALPFADDRFEVATASLFMHHFDAENAVRLLREMQRVASAGIVVSDLHRHPAAYVGVKALAALRPGTSAMFRHDAPLSVRRGYRRRELQALAERAGLVGVRLRWHWAFRWVLTTIM